MKNYIFFVLVLSDFFISSSFSKDFSQYSPSAYDSLNIIEKVYIHADRDSYYAGDDIWFKAYLIDAKDHSLTNHSQNLHVELISPALRIISSSIVRLNRGLGNGDFKLPANIESGRYKLRAYTNYMRNFGEQLFFNKEIVVINSTDSGIISERKLYVENRIHVSFFPEGGSLIDNVGSIVAFKATDYSGKGCYVTGKIYSSVGELITSFKTSHLGMGSFFVRPLPGLSYYSVCRGADSIDHRTDLPASFPKGVTFSTSKNQNNELIITIKTNPGTLEILKDQELLINFSIRREVINSIPVKIKSSVASFKVPTGYLPDGILMLTLTTGEELPLTERLLYIEKEAPLKLQIQTDKYLYKKRDSINLKISLPGDSIDERHANISLAVVDEKFINSTAQSPRTISSWFLLESDIRGNVENPSYYFDPSNAYRLKDLDLLLLTQGWRDFAWKYKTKEFPPEKGFTISGRLRKYLFNKPIEDSRVSIGVFGNNSSFLTSVPVDSSGSFKLSGLDFAGEGRLIVTGIGKKGRLQGVLNLDSVFYIAAKVSDSLTPVSVLVDNRWSFLKTYYEVNESIRRKYRLSDTISLGEVKIITERRKDLQTLKVERSRQKYDQPDSEIKVTPQMQSYPYLIEILRGHVPGVIVTGTYPDYKIIIRGLGSIKAQGPPLVLIDGMEASFEDLIYMPIAAIDRIDVLKTMGSTSIFGLRGSGGVINLITRAGGLAYVPVTYSHNINIKGYSTSRVFYSPQHLSDSDLAFDPDLRSTLLWEPQINLDGDKEVNLKYYNGDNSALIRITAEGITNSGIPVTGTSEYEVK